MFTRILAVAALAAPLASAAIIDVFVGGTGKLEFTPNSVSANPGDSIRFTFGPKNHTVTQSTFANPCSPMTDATTGAQTGFFSGYMPVAGTQTTDLPQFWIPVKDTKPIWAFCSQANHCQQGMVFAVNAPADPDPKSFNNFKALATGGATATPAPAVTVSTSIGPVATATASAVTDPNAAAGADPYNYGSSDPSASASAAASSTVSANSAAATGATGTVHQVIVGGTGVLTFQPDHLTAAEGDVVQFVFHAKNHTATQSSFKSPCSPLAGGFDSGFMPSTDAGPNFPTYSYTVTNASAPIWVYCKQGNHCAQGMVFAINTNENSPNTFAAFQAAAKGGASPSASASGSAASSTVTANSAASAVGGSKGVAVALAAVSMIFALAL
jgi:plastocyanin